MVRSVASLLLVLAPSLATNLSPSLVTSLVQVAQCRASLASTDLAWELCLRLAPAAEDREAVCAGAEAGGAAAAVCRHYLLTNTTPQHQSSPAPAPGLYTFPRPAKMWGCWLAWPQLRPASNQLVAAGAGAGSVSLVLGQDGAGQWYELGQTTARLLQLRPAMAAKLARVVVVGVRPGGVADTLSLDTSPGHCGHPHPRPQPAAAPRPVLTSACEPMTASGQLCEVGLGWAGPGSEAEYQLQWGRVGGASTGSLVTREAAASLALETGTVYWVTLTSIATGAVSPPLLVSTHPAPAPAPAPGQMSPEGVALVLLLILGLAAASVLAVRATLARRSSSQARPGPGAAEAGAVVPGCKLAAEDSAASHQRLLGAGARLARLLEAGPRLVRLLGSLLLTRTRAEVEPVKV